MANIKCKSCGRRYSYHDSDLCPYCGAYNRPPSRMRVDFDQEGNAELLNEQQFQQSAANQSRKVCYEHETVWEDDKTPARGGVTTGKLVALAAVLVTVFIVLCLLINFAGERTPEPDISEDWVYSAEAPAEEIANAPIFYQELGEQFVIDGQPVRVETVGFDTEELQATVYWENEAIYTPELHVLYENGSELFTFTWYEENVGENLWRYSYTNDGFGWEDVAEAYLSFSANDGTQAYDIWVDITAVFQSTQ